MGTVRAVLFDADGVVQQVTPGWRERLHARLGPHPDADAVIEELFAAEVPTLTGASEFETVVGSVLAERAQAADTAQVLRSWYEIEVDRLVLDTIAALRARSVRCYLATNQHTARAGYMRRHLGYGEVFDEQFYSCELGVAKPDPAYFTAILDRLALPAQDVLFLDDNEPNVRAAASVGMHAHLYPRSQAGELAPILAAYGLGGRGAFRPPEPP